MDSRQFLSQVFNLNRTIKGLQEYADRLRLQATESGQNFSGSGTAAHDDSQGSKIDNLISKAIDIQNIVDKKKIELITIQADVTASIIAISDTQCINVLIERYLNCKDWKNVAGSLGYSEDYTKTIHRKALRLVVVPEKYKGGCHEHCT